MSDSTKIEKLTTTAFLDINAFQLLIIPHHGSGVSKESSDISSASSKGTSGSSDIISSSASFKSTSGSSSSISSSSKLLEIENIYPDKIPGEMGTAIECLSKSIDLIENSIIEFGDNRVISDEYMQQFQALLPDLFYCRTIGEGFGIIITTLMIAISNKNGIPLELDQLIILKYVLVSLKREPFLSTSKAVKLCDDLNEKGFEVNNIINDLDKIISDIIP
jgi:hypothetical protein